MSNEAVQIEQDKEIPVIEGTTECPQQRIHLFKTKAAMTDFIRWSPALSVGSFRYGVHQQTGEYVYELTYFMSEN